MSRVIKAGQVRSAGERTPARPDTPAPAPDESRTDYQERESAMLEKIEAAARRREEEFNAAYQELVSTAQEEVALMLEDARAEAARLVADAERQCAELRQQAHEAGLQEGYAQAERETMELLERGQAEVDALLESAAAERIRLLEQAEPETLRLSLDVAEKILRYELEHNNSAYMSLLTEALNHVKTEGHVTLHVNSADYIRFFGSRDKLKVPTENGTVSAAVTVDPSIEGGGCLIETESGMVDAGVQAQIEQLASSFQLTMDN